MSVALKDKKAKSKKRKVVKHFYQDIRGGNQERERAEMKSEPAPVDIVYFNRSGLT